MKRKLIGFAVSLVTAWVWLSGCDKRAATAETTTTTEAAADSTVTTIAAVSMAADTNKITVRIHSFENYSAADIAYAKQAAQVLEKLLNSADFKQKLLHCSFKGGENPAEVYKDIMLAHEQVAPPSQPTQDHVLDFWLRLDDSDLDCNGRSIGGDDDAGGFVNTCPKRVKCWVANGCVASMADHLLHEYMHHLGYEHKSKRVEPDVPYVVGDTAVYALLTDPKGAYRLKDCEDWPNNTGPCAH